LRPRCRDEGQPAGPESGSAVRANRLLDRLAGTNRERFLASCEPIDLEAGQVLMRPGVRAAHAWFPIDAIVSLGMAEGGEQHSFEVGLVGSEGMVGIPLLLGSNASSLRATVVRPGAALRISAARLRLQLRSSEAFRERMQQYVLVSLTQLAQAALCTRYHRVEERLARWLLMTQDRAPRGPVYATHEFLAAALGVRRGRRHPRSGDAAAAAAHRLPPRRADRAGPRGPAGRCLRLLRRGPRFLHAGMQGPALA
jgi:CRP-like cAMP-binding protein